MSRKPTNIVRPGECFLKYPDGRLVNVKDLTPEESRAAAIRINQRALRAAGYEITYKEK